MVVSCCFMFDFTYLHKQCYIFIECIQYPVDKYVSSLFLVAVCVLKQFAGSVINTVTWCPALKSKVWVRFPLSVSEVCVLITVSAAFFAGRLPLKYHQNAGKIHVKIQFRGVRC